MIDQLITIDKTTMKLQQIYNNIYTGNIMHIFILHIFFICSLSIAAFDHPVLKHQQPENNFITFHAHTKNRDTDYNPQVCLIKRKIQPSQLRRTISHDSQTLENSTCENLFKTAICLSTCMACTAVIILGYHVGLVHQTHTPAH